MTRTTTTTHYHPVSPCITLYHLVSPCSSVLLPPSTWYRQVQSGSEHESEERSVQWAVYSAVVHFCVSNRWWLVLPPCITLYHPVSPCSSVVLPCTTSFYLLQRSTEWFRAVQKSDLYSALRIVLFVHFWVTGGDSYYYNYALPPCITLYHLVSPCITL